MKRYLVSKIFSGINIVAERLGFLISNSTSEDIVLDVRTAPPIVRICGDLMVSGSISTPFSNAIVCNMAFGDVDQIINTKQLLTRILHSDPADARVWTLPTASYATEGLINLSIGYSIDFSVINRSIDVSNMITLKTNETTFGDLVVGALVAGRAQTGVFRLIFTNIGVGTEAYELYRIG